jgi:S1-C subfamily serine protease
MKKVLFTLFMVAIGVSISWAEVYLPGNMENSLVTFEKTVIDSTDGSSVIIPHGTGFLVSSDSITAYYIITNRHILEGRDSILVRVNKIDALSHSVVGIRHMLPLKVNGFSIYMGHPDPNVDLAIVVYPHNEAVYSLPSDRLKMLDNVKLGDPVLFLGFPLLEAAIGDLNYPITRKGVVSYISHNDVLAYKSNVILIDKGRILIDGNIMPGNSGSPVLSVSSTETDEKASLIGVMSGHLERSELMANQLSKLFGLTTTIDYKLGICIPADRVKELLTAYDIYLIKIGFGEFRR